MLKNNWQPVRALVGAKILRHLVMLVVGMAYAAAAGGTAHAQKSIFWFMPDPYTDTKFSPTRAQATIHFGCTDGHSDVERIATIVQLYICENGNEVTNKATLRGQYHGVYVEREGVSFNSFTGGIVAESIAGRSDCDGSHDEPFIITNPNNCSPNAQECGCEGGGGEGGGGGSGGGWYEDGGMTYCYQYCTQTGSRYCQEENPYDWNQCDQWSDWEYGEPQCGYVECFGV